MYKEPLISISALDTLDLSTYLDVVKEISRINREHVDIELETFAAEYSYYYGLMVRSKRNLDEATNTAENYRSCYKNESRKAGKKTVEALNDEVNCQKDCVELNKDVVRKEEIHGLMKGICNTLSYKKDMLVQLSANKREEAKIYN
jgi:hypothetical protein